MFCGVNVPLGEWGGGEAETDVGRDRDRETETETKREKRRGGEREETDRLRRGMREEGG